MQIHAPLAVQPLYSLLPPPVPAMAHLILIPILINAHHALLLILIARVAQSHHAVHVSTIYSLLMVLAHALVELILTQLIIFAVLAAPQ